MASVASSSVSTASRPWLSVGTGVKPAATATTIVTDCVTCGAASQLASPAWSAVRVQTPRATMVTVLPTTVHTPGVALP